MEATNILHSHDHVPHAKSYEGSCFCGSVQFTVSGEPAAMGYCHCESCRTWSAGPVNAFTLWPPAAVKITRGADKVGTFSNRRAAQLLVHRPDLQLASLRGNVDTRVAKAQAGEFDAIVIAAAGVHRLGLTSAITEYLPLEIMLPAPGQGALAVQCRTDDAAMLELLRGLEERDVRAATDAERGFLEGLGGGCAAPIAAFGRAEERRIHLEGLVLSLDGQRQIRLVWEGPAADGRRVGLRLAAEARSKGAEALLA